MVCGSHGLRQCRGRGERHAWPTKRTLFRTGEGQWSNIKRPAQHRRRSGHRCSKSLPQLLLPEASLRVWRHGIVRAAGAERRVVIAAEGHAVPAAREAERHGDAPRQRSTQASRVQTPPSGRPCKGCSLQRLQRCSASGPSLTKLCSPSLQRRSACIRPAPGHSPPNTLQLGVPSLVALLRKSKALNPGAREPACPKTVPREVAAQTKKERVHPPAALPASTRLARPLACAKPCAIIAGCAVGVGAGLARVGGLVQPIAVCAVLALAWGRRTISACVGAVASRLAPSESSAAGSLW